jgi:hypothetical protein
VVVEVERHIEQAAVAQAVIFTQRVFFLNLVATP